MLSSVIKPKGKMENAEEVMQLLEDFSKVKPKEIPPELEHYLTYVAATGDPVFQWTLVKSLFREKLLIVITDFFESTLTVELPPCPNVEPFNYERMKTCLLERLDTFTSAPFTVQRICELLTNPRKEYNRADKYMRAIEKNILVVSTREPGSGKRPLECDSQQETILNGMPDVKLNVSDGSLLHVPTDLPYLGAPPASNDVTIETTESTFVLTGGRENLDVTNCDDDCRPKPNTVQSDVSKPDQPMQEPADTNRKVEIGLSLSSSNDAGDIGILNIEIVNSGNADNVSPTFDCDTNDKLSSLNDAPSTQMSTDRVSDEVDACEISVGTNESDLPDSLDSSDLLQNKTDEVMKPCTTVLDCQETVSMSDENEVSSSPAESSLDKHTLSGSENVEEPTDSEAEASDSTEIGLDKETSKHHTVQTAETSDVDQSDETKLITITEVTAAKSDEISLECDEVTGTVVSPISPENNSLPQADENVVESVCALDENDLEESHPDSSNDACLKTTESPKPSLVESETEIVLDSSSEADSMSEAKPKTESVDSVSAPDEAANECSSVGVEQVFSPAVIESPQESNLDSNLPMSSNLELSEESVVSEGQPVITLPDESPKVQKVETPADTQSGEMFNQDKREESVIHSTLLHEGTVVNKEMLTCEEEISMDPNCEAEEAMDVDDTSNQMLVSEGENESEPMDESDQVQS